MNEIEIIVLDQISKRAFTTHVKIEPDQDTDEAVDLRLDELGFLMSNCSYMQIDEDFDGLEKIEQKNISS